MSYIHTGENVFYCQNCGYKCSQTNFLKRHMHYHTGEKILSCSECDQKCKKSCSKCDYLPSVISNDKNIKCLNKCDINFRKQILYCPNCGYKFTQFFCLKRHMLHHTGENISACTECDYKNRYSCHKCDFLPSLNVHDKNIKYHMKSHTQENRKYKSKKKGYKEHTQKGLLKNICFIVILTLLCYTFVISISAQFSNISL